MADNLRRLAIKPKTGNESFSSDSRSIGRTLRDFWSWAYSDVVSNTERGVLAEYIVGLALDVVDDGVRVGWENYDLATLDGIRVEVKAAGYIQSWSQKNLSSLQFTVEPTSNWDEETGVYSAERFRSSDVYVFCLHHHQEKTSIDPLNLDQWTFYVVATAELDRVIGQQKTITVGALLSKLRPTEVGFPQLREAIYQVRRSGDG